MKIAVTGAGGFVGLNIVRRLAQAGHDILALDRNFGPRSLAVIDEAGAERVEANVLDADALDAAFGDFKPEALFHGATLTADLGREMAAFSDILSVNVVGTGKVLESALTAGVRRVVAASSSAVYGGAVFSSGPQEDIAPQPTTLYGITKLASEQSALRFGEIHGLDIRIARIAAVFGAYEHRSGARDAMSPLFQIGEHALAGRNATLPEGGARDWISGERVADIVGHLLELPEVPHRIFNVAAAQTWLPAVFADEVARIFDGFGWSTDSQAPSVDYRDDVGRRRFALDTTRIRALLGDDILGTPQTDAAAYARWTRANPDWFS